jgi:hypothetical protein
MSYCLFGIFEINLPLLYGEGGPKAFTRLQEQIMKDSNDLTLFAWTSDRQESTIGGSLERGILASTPNEFLNAGNLTHVQSDALVASRHIGSDSDFTMTNKGLRIDTPLAYHLQYLVMPLNCVDMSALNEYEPCTGPALRTQLGILLIDVGGIYRRVKPGLLVPIPEDTWWRRAGSAIFVDKQGFYGGPFRDEVSTKPFGLQWLLQQSTFKNSRPRGIRRRVVRSLLLVVTLMSMFSFFLVFVLFDYPGLLMDG